MARRQHLTLILMVGLVVFFSLTWFMSSSGTPSVDPLSDSGLQYATSESLKKQPLGGMDFSGLDGILTGGSIAPKLGNETAKYVSLRCPASVRSKVIDIPSFPTEPNSAAPPGNSSTP